MSSPEVRVRALDDAALGLARKLVWAICIGVYLTVFFGGLQAGGSELSMLGRAAAFTVIAAILGRVALGLLAGASISTSRAAGRMADQDGPVGSLVDRVGSTNVAQQIDEAEAA